MTRNQRLTAAIAMFLGVALGAFGAHALKPVLEGNGTRDIWVTATFYHLIHGLALWLPAIQATRAFWFFTAGIGIFSGSLYVLAISGIGWLGAITPIGGLCFLLGWVLAARQGVKSD